MEFPHTPPPAAGATVNAAAVATPSHTTPSSPVLPLTDTQLLQLSLINAVTAAAAGKTTVAANNYALVIKMLFRKCFLLEELVLLALAMGYDARTAAQHAATAAVDASAAAAAEAEKKRETQAHSNTSAEYERSAAAASAVDPLASVGMLLPPGLDEKDYEEERNYYEQKLEREAARTDTLMPPQQPSKQKQTSSSSSLSVAKEAENVPGYDAATARWLARLLAKVHPDALPIATLEKLCKVPIPSRSTGLSRAASFGSQTSTLRVDTNTAAINNSAFPTSAAAAAGGGGFGIAGSAGTASVFSPNSAKAIARLFPHLEGPSTATMGNHVGSPTLSAATSAGRTGPNSPSEQANTASPVSHTSASLSLLFATLLWDVACALWNEGFIEDSHHWLAVMDVRRLWKLYADSYSVNANRGGGRVNTSASPSNTAPSVGSSSLFRTGEPPEEAVDSEDRACALSWLAVLAECGAAGAPPQTPPHGKAAANPNAEKTVNKTAPRMIRPRSRITLSAFDGATGLLPMTSLGPNSHTDLHESGNQTDRDVPVGDGQEDDDEANINFNTQQHHDNPISPDSPDVSDASAAAAPAAAADERHHCESTAMFVRRLARRTSALRDLCGLMIACQTAEDVVYVVYAFNCALTVQQRKKRQQQRLVGTTSTAAPPNSTGALAEVLVVVNLLVEHFLAKRAQRILIDAGILSALPATSNAAAKSADDSYNANSLAAAATMNAVNGGSGGGVQHGLHGEQAHKVDRAIRLACDELVSAFTNGQCGTLYALEAYGIPAPHDAGGTGVQLLAPELPYVLVSNVLSSTLNFATLYRLSKVFQGVMRVHHCEWHENDTTLRTRGQPPTNNVLAHPNRTRKATEVERQRRRQWTRVPSVTGGRSGSRSGGSCSSTTTTNTSAPQQQAAGGQSVMGELMGLVRGVADFILPSTSSIPPSTISAAETGEETPSHDVRPSRVDPRALDGAAATAAGGLGRGSGSGGYAERLAEARRERAASAGETGRGSETMPWSRTPAKAMTDSNSGLADASAAAISLSSELRTSGPRASELLLPSHPFTSSTSTSTAVSTTHNNNSVLFPLSLLVEESERDGLIQRTAASTLLYTPTIELASRTPSEAASLRLLTLLIRYPQLHKLEPITPAHVDLVAQELNKALHIIQIAMRDRFGETWWQHWKTRRESETQRYYARALADAQRGGNVLSALSTTTSAATSLATPQQQQMRSAITAAADTAGGGEVGEAVRPPSMVGTTAVQSDPSLLLRAPAEQQQHVQAVVVVPPPSAPQPTPRQEPVLSTFWNTRTLSIPTQEAMRERRQHARLRSTEGQRTEEDDTALNIEGSGGGPVSVTDASAIEVSWDVPPAYTPEVSLDFSAFTTTSVETQEATRRLVEELQRQQHAADAANANVPGVSLLSAACRRLLHMELPLSQQYAPWRVIYSTRTHGVSLATLLANCRQEQERHLRQSNGLYSLPSATDSGAANVSVRPMLLVMELPASTTFQFAEDDSGVLAALAEQRASITVEQASRATATRGGNERLSTVSPYNKLYIGAYLSDLLRLESRRYYGTQDCFVFQILVPGVTDGAAAAAAAAATASDGVSAPQPQLRTFHASRQNTQFINCRTTSIVLGGGGSGSSVYLDSSLCHGATSACATFNAPPLSRWETATAAKTLCALAGVQQPQQEEQQQQQHVDAGGEPGYQHSLCVLNVEVIVMDV